MTRTETPVIGEPGASEGRRVRDLERQLAEAEATIQMLRSGLSDAVVDATNDTPLLLAKAQDALTESEERYREQAALLDIAHEAILVKDLDGRILYWNKGAERTFGWTAAETLGRNAGDFLHTEGIGFHDARTALLAAGAWNGEQTGRTKDGRGVLVESGWTLVRDREGRPKSIFAIHTDITERRRAMEAIRAADERTRFALTSANVGVWDLDYATGSLRWSETLEAQYGLQPGTFAGTFDAFVACLHPDDRESVLETIGKAVASGVDFSLQHRALWPDGTVQWLKGAGRIHLGPDGSPVRAVGISQNVTGRKSAEAALAHLNDEIHVQRLRVFKATMRTVQDIVNNVLNSFQLVRLEIGDQLPEEVLAQIDRMVEEASGKLKALGDLETINEKEMDVGLGIEYPGSLW